MIKKTISFDDHFLLLDQSFVPTKISIDPFEYKNLTSTVTTSESRLTPNEYEQINSSDRKSQRFEERDHSLERLETISKQENTLIHNSTRQKSRSVDDLSRTSYDQTSSKNSNLIFHSIIIEFFF
jgi:hypothetical protein